VANGRCSSINVWTGPLATATYSGDLTINPVLVARTPVMMQI
jgi:hypothetical protein